MAAWLFHNVLPEERVNGILEIHVCPHHPVHGDCGADVDHHALPQCEPRESIEHMLETVDKLTDRIGTLESILDVDHSDWRQQVSREERDKE